MMFFFNQHHITRAAFDQTYSRKMYEIGLGLYKKVTIERLNKVDDLYLITEFTDHNEAPTTLESWKAYYNWATRQLIEIGGQKRVLYFETEKKIMYKESGDNYPIVLEVFRHRLFFL